FLCALCVLCGASVPSRPRSALCPRSACGGRRGAIALRRRLCRVPEGEGEMTTGFAEKIRDVPDFPQPGILFKDITTLLKDGAAFRQVIDALYERCRDRGATKVVGIESRGFIFAAPLAYRLGVGFVPARKLGRLPA